MEHDTQTVLVAFVVSARDMELAQEALMDFFNEDQPTYIDSWWMAEDERYDGSDCDSASFTGTYHHGDRTASWARAMQYLRTHMQESIDPDDVTFDETGDKVLFDGSVMEDLMNGISEEIQNHEWNEE